MTSRKRKKNHIILQKSKSKIFSAILAFFFGSITKYSVDIKFNNMICRLIGSSLICELGDKTFLTFLNRRKKNQICLLSEGLFWGVALLLPPPLAISQSINRSISHTSGAMATPVLDGLWNVAINCNQFSSIEWILVHHQSMTTVCIFIWTSTFCCSVVFAPPPLSSLKAALPQSVCFAPWTDLMSDNICRDRRINTATNNQDVTGMKTVQLYRSALLPF